MLDSADDNTRRSAIGAIKRVKPRDSDTLARLRARATETTGRVQREAKEALQEIASDITGEFDSSLTGPDRVMYFELLGIAGDAETIPLLLQHLGPDALDDHLDVRRSAAAAIREITTHVELDVALLDQLVYLVDGEDLETDTAALADLQEALHRAKLGDDVAIAILYDMLGLKPKASPDALFGNEKAALLRQLSLYRLNNDRGAPGRGASIAHLDLVAERIVRAFYTRLGDSDALKQKIGTGDTKDVKYGAVLQALEHVARFSKSAPPLKALHDLRSDKTEITHDSGAGAATEADATTAKTLFIKGVKGLVGALGSNGDITPRGR